MAAAGGQGGVPGGGQAVPRETAPAPDGHVQITEEDIERYRHLRDSVTDPQPANRCRGFIGDDRLTCTLLLSAPAPSVPALRDLTIRRLGALDHRSVLSLIPGAEVGVIKAKVDEWASRFAEIKATGTATNPGVRLELAEVDGDSAIANADVNSSASNRRALAKRLFAEELGLSFQERLVAVELQMVWRGSHRTAEVVFGNLAHIDDFPDHEFSSSQDGFGGPPSICPITRASRVPSRTPAVAGQLRAARVHRDLAARRGPAHHGQAVGPPVPRPPGPGPGPRDACMCGSARISPCRSGSRQGPDAEEHVRLPSVDRRALNGPKFSVALPPHLAEATLAAPMADMDRATVACVNT
ncbi:hypothetical protein [Streptomyces sp. NPDC086010]|uniref:hypothetical protein n=1 Tax=Streptomyces sp. NPDC086010 TaxID=3365745 RepID=UPI0037CED36E